MDDISSLGAATTPFGHQDRLRPEAMLRADRVVNNLSDKLQMTAGEATTFSVALSSVIKSTRGTELDQLWKRVESALNQGQSISEVSKLSTVEQVKTTAALFYSMMNLVDKESNTQLMSQFRTAYIEGRKHIEERFLPQLESTQQNLLKRIIRITDRRMQSVVKRMNRAVDAGEVAGPKIFVDSFSS